MNYVDGNTDNTAIAKLFKQLKFQEWNYRLREVHILPFLVLI